jgi:hypothetical protein
MKVIDEQTLQEGQDARITGVEEGHKRRRVDHDHHTQDKE